MSHFDCEQCRKRITLVPEGQLTGCEHHPMPALEAWPNNKRSSFLRVLIEYTREENVVTKSVIRQILKGRIDREDLS